MAFGPGSIAFTGFNADGNDNLAFAAMQNIAAGTVITFTDNEWDGASFATGESTWTWTAGSDLVAGTVVTMDNLAAGQTATSNTGAIAFSEETDRNIDDAMEMVYAYVGDASAPTFLTAIANGVYYYQESGILNNTGLDVGINAVAFDAKDPDADILAYTGPRVTGESLDNLRALLFGANNWTTQNTGGDDSADSVGPDAPFDATPFTVDPAAQKIAFSADSLTVTHPEGDSGTTTYTFVVERTNGTTGDVDFTGRFARGNTTAADYGGTLPGNFSGTIAAGETSATVTITVTGDSTYEANDETFSLVLQTVNNAEATAYLSANAPESKATGVIVNDDTQQVVGFAADSVTVLVVEGNDGTKTVTFTIERTGNGGTVGDVAFSGSFNKADMDAADFGGTLPEGTFSGVIPAGQTSVTLSFTFSGDQLAEGNERFSLLIRSATNPAADSVALVNQQATAWVLNDDGPAVVRAGETFNSLGMTGESSLTIEQGGTLTNLTVTGENFDVTVNNSGRVGFGGTTLTGVGALGNGKITFNNEATGEVSGIAVPKYPTAGSLDLVLNNEGKVGGLAGFQNNPTYSSITINNEAGGLIGHTSTRSGIEVLGNTTINNAGTIITYSGRREGIEYDGANVVVHNLAGGHIEGTHHAVTGKQSVTVTNEAGGTLIGGNGSAVNIDNGVEQVVYVTNRGLMQGKSANSIDSDGDAIDTDGPAVIENWGTIEGLGHSGSHNGGLNVSEGIAMGGGSITNHEGGLIAGYGRAIQVDDSSESGAFTAVTIVNDGTIHGYGNLPMRYRGQGSSQDFVEATEYAPTLYGGEAINIVGTWADTLTNTGVITGGVRMGGGDDVLINSGSMSALKGSAIDMGDGNDTVTLQASSNVTGSILLGAGNDTLTAVAGDVVVDGGDGDDTITGGKGRDTLSGGAGIDIINGGDGNDLISGGEGNDNLQGAAGVDEIHGGDGDDRINGGGSADILFGDAGKDLIYGSDGNDEIHGGADNDQLHGEGDNDIIYGDAGNDTFYGGIGQDTLIGGDGNDQVYGQDGNDTLMGGAGFDKLDGGTGVDTADYSQDAEAIYVRLDQKWAMAQADRLPSWTDLVAGINGNTIEHDDLISIENITGTAFNDAIVGNSGDNVIKGGAGNDLLAGLGGNDTIYGGEGNDRITAGAGDQIYGDQGNDIVEISTVGGAPASVDGGEGNDTVKLLGTGTGALGATTGVENLLVQEGTWSVNGGDYSSITIQDGSTLTSAVALNNSDHLTIDAGGKLTGAISRSGNGDIVVDNSGLIEVSGRVLNGGSSSGTLTLNNLAGATIKQIGSNTDVIRPGQNGTVNNWGTITTGDGFVGGGDLIDFQSSTGGKVNNFAGGWMEGSRHAVTGDNTVTVVNDGTMIGRNGSAINIDNGGTEAEKVFVTNRGTMEGRSATLSDSDGDAVDIDGLAQILNYGRIAGLGANGRHDGEPNVSEGIAIGGGTILNYGANAEIYGYGRAIQVDNSSNSNGLGKTFINNEGLIKGDGHGPEGVTFTPEEVAKFDLRGNEAINLVGDYADEILNQSTGRIVGGVSMGGGNDHLQSLGSFVATGGSAIDMGAGNDTVYFYTGTTVQGTVLLGTGDDLVLSTADSGFVIDAGDGDDQMYISGYTGGDDILSGGAGNDRIYAGLGEDRIDGGADNDSLYGEAGDDLLIGGSGNDIIDGGSDDDVIFGDAGNDTLIGGLGNDVIKGGADNDIFVVQSTGDGRDSYDGGDGIDTLDYSGLNTAVNLTLKDGVTTYQTDTIENIENVIGGSAGDKLTGNSLDNVLTGNAGDDTLKGGAGNDILDGGTGNDNLDGGIGNDQLAGGLNDDVLKGAAGDDHLDGGEGNDDLDGGADNDVITGGAGNDTLTGGAGNDQFVFTGIGDGIDTVTDFKTSGTSEDQFVLSASMFQNFTGDDAFDLVGSGYLRAVFGNGTTQIQIDVDGGGDSFATMAMLTGNISNGVLADHVVIHQDPIA